MTIAPAARAALAQATALAPRRSRASDGLEGDAAHRRRRSWHNRCNRAGDYSPRGVVLAFDLTHDPAGGCDAHRMVREAVARGDRRILEAISKGRIWTRARAAEGWRPYSGSNRHDKHAHVTVAWEHQDDVSPWWTTRAKPAPAADPKELDVDESTLRRIVREEVDEAVALVLRGDKNHPDHLAQVRKDLAALDVPRKAKP